MRFDVNVNGKGGVTSVAQLPCGAGIFTVRLGRQPMISGVHVYREIFLVEAQDFSTESKQPMWCYDRHASSSPMVPYLDSQQRKVEKRRKFNSIVSVLEGGSSDDPIADWFRFVGRNNVDAKGQFWDEEMLRTKKHLVVDAGDSIYYTDETTAPARFASDMQDNHTFKDQFVEVATEDVNEYWCTQVQQSLFNYVDPNEISISMATGKSIGSVMNEHVKWTFLSKSNIVKLKFLCYADRRDFSNRYLRVGQPFAATMKKGKTKKKLTRMWYNHQKSSAKEETCHSLFDYNPDPSWSEREGTREDPDMQVPWASSYRKLFNGVYWDLTKAAYEIRGCKRGRTLLDPRDTVMFINRLKDQLHQEIPTSQIAHAYMECSPEDPNTKVHVYLYVYDFKIAESDEFDPTRLENIVAKLVTAHDTIVNIDVEGRDQMVFEAEVGCICAPTKETDLPTLKELQMQLPGSKTVAHPWPYTPEYIVAHEGRHGRGKSLPTFKDFKVPSRDSTTGGEEFYKYLSESHASNTSAKKKTKKNKKPFLQIVRFTYTDARVLTLALDVDDELDVDIEDDDVNAIGKSHRTFETQTVDFNPETLIEKGITDERKVLLANRLESELESRIWQQDAQFRRNLVNYIYELYKTNAKSQTEQVGVNEKNIEKVVDETFNKRLQGMEKCTDCDRSWHFVKPMKSGAFDMSGAWYCSDCWKATYGENWNLKKALTQIQEEKLLKFRKRAKTQWMPSK